MEDIGRGRRHRGGAGDPVQRLVERRGLEQVHGGGRAGLLHALVEHIAQVSQEGRPAGLGLERAAHTGRGPAAAHERGDEGIRIAVPAHQLADENGRQTIRAGLARAPAAPRQLLGPQLDRTDLAGVRRQLEDRGPAVGGDDRHDLPVELAQPVDEQIAPGAHAPDHVGIGPLRGEEDLCALARGGDEAEGGGARRPDEPSAPRPDGGGRAPAALSRGRRHEFLRGRRRRSSSKVDLERGHRWRPSRGRP